MAKVWRGREWRCDAKQVAAQQAATAGQATQLEGFVSGLLYRLTLKLRETESSGDQAASSSCRPDNNSDAQICYLEVWEKLWKNFFKVQNASCTPESRTRRAVLVSGRSPLSVDNENVQRLTGLAMSRLAQSPGSENKSVIHVVKAEWQDELLICCMLESRRGSSWPPPQLCDFKTTTTRYKLSMQTCPLPHPHITATLLLGSHQQITLPPTTPVSPKWCFSILPPIPWVP
ncbi:hypothetical protein PR048_003816 [Dryococelus australis]|uniref:Uncharacterized protein n=1 Tax=Dryococelus australis TaxID=614101 RepID=A0ABQ9IP28_9NEOP|nr:hypothetical protein PR048_003816 [Dryococelus australis]